MQHEAPMVASLFPLFIKRGDGHHPHESHGVQQIQPALEHIFATSTRSKPRPPSGHPSSCNNFGANVSQSQQLVHCSSDACGARPAKSLICLARQSNYFGALRWRRPTRANSCAVLAEADRAHLRDDVAGWPGQRLPASSASMPSCAPQSRRLRCPSPWPAFQQCEAACQSWKSRFDWPSTASKLWPWPRVSSIKRDSHEAALGQYLAPAVSNRPSGHS